MINFKSVILSQNPLEHTSTLSKYINEAKSSSWSNTKQKILHQLGKLHILNQPLAASTPVTSGGRFFAGKSIFFYFCLECWELLWQLSLHLLHSARGGHSVHVTHGRPSLCHRGYKLPNPTSNKKKRKERHLFKSCQISASTCWLVAVSPWRLASMQLDFLYHFLSSCGLSVTAVDL